MYALRAPLARAPRFTFTRAAANFSRPRPPSLPKEQQREFEELVRKAQAPMSNANGGRSEIEQLHPDVRTKPKGQFEGERNPKTGEVGGPKTDPLTHNEWSYSGRATDF
jgi:hypothetical protein